MYFLGIDQGTTSTRAILYDERFRIVKIARRRFRQIYPAEGWVEHDPNEIWRTVEETVEEVLEGVKREEVLAVGITNQRETVVPWDVESEEVLYNAIVWQCRRTAGRAEELRRSMGDLILEKTGLVVDPYFSATKMEWLLKNVNEVKKAKDRGTLRFGTIDSYLAWKMTGRHVTDVTNASRTMLFNIRSLNWDDELLELFSIPRWTLPEVVNSSEIVGETIWGIPLAGIVGDQQGALFGQMAFDVGDVKVTLGTGSFILINIGKKPLISRSGLLTTVAWKIGDEVTYALEGSVFITGALIDWFISIGLFSNPEEISKLAYDSKNGGVYVVPALTGLGAPHWDPYARGLIIGITRSTNRSNIARAVLEAIAFSIKELIDLMESEFGGDVGAVKVDGGVSKSDTLLEIMADATGKRIERPVNLETTSTGAVMLASLAVGAMDLDRMKEFREVSVSLKRERGLKEEYENWKEAVRRSLNWAR